MEDVERRLTVMEEKLFAALLAATPEAALLQVRTEADRDLAPYRSRMKAPADRAAAQAVRAEAVARTASPAAPEPVLYAVSLTMWY